jgi:hypothetical protein
VQFPVVGVYVVVEVEGRYHVIEIIYDWGKRIAGCELYWGFETPYKAVSYIERLAGFRVPRRELLELLRLLVSRN